MKVRSHLSKHFWTKGCLDKWNVEITEVWYHKGWPTWCKLYVEWATVLVLSCWHAPVTSVWYTPDSTGSESELLDIACVVCARMRITLLSHHSVSLSHHAVPSDSLWQLLFLLLCLARRSYPVSLAVIQQVEQVQKHLMLQPTAKANFPLTKVAGNSRCGLLNAFG